MVRAFEGVPKADKPDQPILRNRQFPVRKIFLESNIEQISSQFYRQVKQFLRFVAIAKPSQALRPKIKALINSTLEDKVSLHFGVLPPVS